MLFPGTDAALQPPEVARRRAVRAHPRAVPGTSIRVQEPAVQGESNR
jgi:hypothetical protein